MIYVGKIKVKFVILSKKTRRNCQVRRIFRGNLLLCFNFRLDENDPDETFSVEYAKSSRSRCHGCDLSIVKDHLRLSRKNFSSRRARKYGPVDEWYHVDCFNQKKKDLVFVGTAESFVLIVLSRMRILFLFVF